MGKVSYLRTFINYHIAQGDIEFTANSVGELESVSFNNDVYESLSSRMMEIDAIGVKGGNMSRELFDKKYSYRSNYDQVVKDYIENE
jgi:hypothetical protein